MTERLHFHFWLSCTGEGNGNPLQCSCLENPRDGGAWWAAVCGVAQSRTRLKWLSSSSWPFHLPLLLISHKLKKKTNKDYFLKAYFIFCLCWVFVAVWAFSSCAARGLLSRRSARISHCVGCSCCGVQALECVGFSSCGSQALEHRLNSCAPGA